MEGPHVLTAQYAFPWDRFLGLALSLAFSRRRSLSVDCATVVARMTPAPVIEGIENIPANGPVLVTANHFQRRGLWIGWPGAVITTAIAQTRGAEPPLHWLVTGGLPWSQWKGEGSEVPLTRSIFDAVAVAYEMAALPLSGAPERAAAIRRWVGWARAGHALGIFPEGLHGKAETLGPPEPGFDALCRILTPLSIQCVPCGIWERENGLYIRFGVPFRLQREWGSKAGGHVMEHIAVLVPSQMRGPYSHATSSPFTGIRVATS
ncbi:MAG: hypothetical protein NVSMB52_04580 [Chloroflexota bacterium]